MLSGLKVAVLLLCAAIIGLVLNCQQLARRIAIIEERQAKQALMSAWPKDGNCAMWDGGGGVIWKPCPYKPATPDCQTFDTHNNRIIGPCAEK